VQIIQKLSAVDDIVHTVRAVAVVGARLAPVGEAQGLCAREGGAQLGRPAPPRPEVSVQAQARG
jgi:hypothetical protein